MIDIIIVGSVVIMTPHAVGGFTGSCRPVADGLGRIHAGILWKLWK